MGLLAYDPERVSRLRQQLAEASLDLRGVRCTDPAAADAMRTVRSCVEQLDTVWLPFVTRLLDSDPLAGLVRKALHINSLDQSLIRVMAEGYGWAVQVDPLADIAAVVTVEEARALAAMLDDVEPMALADDPDELAWLAQQLAIIGRDPVLSAEFLTNFHNWDSLPCVLAEQRAYSYKAEYEGTTTASQLDPVFDGLMAIWRTTLPPSTFHAGTDASVAGLLPPMDDPDAYAQALMLRSLHLGPATLATVTNELLRAWLDNKEGGGGSRDLAVATGPNVADLLLPTIASDATASAYFLSLIVDRPALLFQTLDDPELAYTLALRGTDPQHTTSVRAGESVLSILGYFGGDHIATGVWDDGNPGTYGPFLGQLVAPWLLQFSGSNTEWTAEPETRVRLLGVALDDETALTALVAAGTRITDGLARSLTTPRNESDTIDLSLQIGGLLGLLGQLVVNEHIDDANERSTFMWDLTWAVLAAATNFMPGGPVANVAAGTGVMALESVLAPHFLGPTGDDVRHEGEYAMDVALTVTASVMMTAMYQSWQSSGRIDADATPPPLPSGEKGCPSIKYRQRFESWARQLPGGLNGPLGSGALNLVGSFIGVGQAGEHCAELAA